MIYDVEEGDLGLVFSNGVEVDLQIERVDTETGEVLHIPQPFRIKDGKVVRETIVLENVTFEPL